MATKVSVRQQLEAALLRWLSASFSTATEFAGVTFAKGQQSGAVAMPLAAAICSDAQEEEVPGIGLFRVSASIVLMTTIDDGTTPDASHRERADLVANRTEEVDAMKSYLNSTGLVYVFGLGAGKSSHGVEDRHFVDKFELEVHCRCA